MKKEDVGFYMIRVTEEMSVQRNGKGKNTVPTLLMTGNNILRNHILKKYSRLAGLEPETSGFKPPSTLSYVL